MYLVLYESVDSLQHTLPGELIRQIRLNLAKHKITHSYIFNLCSFEAISTNEQL